MLRSEADPRLRGTTGVSNGNGCDDASKRAGEEDGVVVGDVTAHTCRVDATNGSAHITAHSGAVPP